MSTLNEYQARLFVGEKALEMGRGGTSHLSKLTGMSRVTITSGVAELRGGRKLRAAGAGRVRAPGGGRKKVEQADPGLCCENSKKKMCLRFALRSALVSGSDSEQVANKPRLACRIFLCDPPDYALPNHVDRLD